MDGGEPPGNQLGMTLKPACFMQVLGCRGLTRGQLDTKSTPRRIMNSTVSNRLDSHILLSIGRRMVARDLRQAQSWKVHVIRVPRRHPLCAAGNPVGITYCPSAVGPKKAARNSLSLPGQRCVGIRRGVDPPLSLIRLPTSLSRWWLLVRKGERPASRRKVSGASEHLLEIYAPVDNRDEPSPDPPAHILVA